MNPRALAIAISLLLGIAAAVVTPGPVSAAAAGRLVIATDDPARPLQVESVSIDGGISLAITGRDPGEHQLYFDPDGTLRLRFPGTILELREDLSPLGAEVEPSRLDTLVVSMDGWRLASLVSSAEGVRLTLSRAALYAAPEYRIGVGDKLRLEVHGVEELQEQEVRVVGEGTVAIPYAGDVKVVGMTEAEAAAEVTLRLSEGYLRDPRLSLEIVEYQSQRVNVSGQVQKPGRYYLKGRTTLVDILAEAGGLSKEAGSEIRIVRPGRAGQPEEVRVVRRENLYLTDDPAANPLLKSGDNITVSEPEYFFIKGEVKSPGRYAVSDRTTILRAISLAGGFDEFANHKKVELLRANGEETVRIVINVEKIENRKADDLRVLPGDIINVKARFL